MWKYLCCNLNTYIYLDLSKNLYTLGRALLAFSLHFSITVTDAHTMRTHQPRVRVSRRKSSLSSRAFHSNTASAKNAIRVYSTLILNK